MVISSCRCDPRGRMYPGDGVASRFSTSRAEIFRKRARSRRHTAEEAAPLGRRGSAPRERGLLVEAFDLAELGLGHPAAVALAVAVVPALPHGGGTRHHTDHGNDGEGDDPEVHGPTLPMEPRCRRDRPRLPHRVRDPDELGRLRPWTLSRTSPCYGLRASGAGRFRSPPTGSGSCWGRTARPTPSPASAESRRCVERLARLWMRSAVSDARNTGSCCRRGSRVTPRPSRWTTSWTCTCPSSRRDGSTSSSPEGTVTLGAQGVDGPPRHREASWAVGRAALFL